MSRLQRHPRLVRFGLMVLLAVVVNRYFAAHQSAITSSTASDPNATHAAVALPGTIIVAQQGALYSLQGNQFTAMTAKAGWSQPARLPGGGLLAVQHGAQWSDLFMLGFDGSITQQLTNNKAALQDADHIADNNWVLNPHVGADGRVYFAYDVPKSGYRVDLAVWSAPLGPVTQASARQETTPRPYTGGDVSPLPLDTGGLVFVKYSLQAAGTHTAQVWWQSDSGSPGHALTAPTDQCAEPAISPDGAHIAMICSAQEQTSDVVVVTFDPTHGTIGPLQRVVTGQLAAQPVWSPDGQSLIYMAPQGAAGFFQLWWLDGATTAQPKPPVAVTSGVDLDATSAPLWLPPAS